MAVNGWSKLKNVEPALKAFARLRSIKTHLCLKLYGVDFGAGERAEQWARHHRIADGMEFIGSIPHRQLLNELARADILIHPSLEETFGMTVAEAMAQGVPVVGGAKSGAVPWVVGEGGLLVDVTSIDAIERAFLELLGDPERYRAMAEQAKARACTEFSAPSVAEEYESLYRVVCGAAQCSGSLTFPAP